MSKRDIRTLKGPPEWTQNLTVKEELNGGFTALSDGWLQRNGPLQLERHRESTLITDSARWSKGLTEGKHVFEIDWPENKNRGMASCVGVGTTDIPLRTQGRGSPLCTHSRGWGLDIRKKSAIHLNKVEKKMDKPMPERFFMYVDLDGGKIGFGDDVMLHGRNAEFYGYCLHNIPTNPEAPLYVTVSSCNPGEIMQVQYRGTAVPSGGFDLCAQAQPFQISNVHLDPSLEDYAEQPPPYSMAIGATPNLGVDKSMLAAAVQQSDV